MARDSSTASASKKIKRFSFTSASGKKPAKRTPLSNESNTVSGNKQTNHAYNR